MSDVLTRYYANNGQSVNFNINTEKCKNESIAKQRHTYNKLINNPHLLKSTEKALHKSFGIKEYEAITYTAASRISMPSLHCDMGVSNHIVDIEKKEMEYLDQSVEIEQLTHDQKMKGKELITKYNIFHNKVYQKQRNNKTTFITDEKKAKKIIRNVTKLKHKDKSNFKIHEKKMLKYGVYQNRYYHNIEGKQAFTTCSNSNSNLNIVKTGKKLQNT
eukprot:60355_1